MKSYLIGIIAGGSIFLLTQLGSDAADESWSIRVATLATATLIGAGVGAGAQKLFLITFIEQPSSESPSDPNKRRMPPNMQNYQTGKKIPETFICHASEDKESVARPLRDALAKLGITAWLDEFEILN